MTRKLNYLYIAIALVIYVIVVAFPVYAFTSDMLAIRIVELSLRVAYLIFIILFAFFTGLAKSYTGKTRYSNLFLLLPIFFVAFTNIFYLGVIQGRTSFFNPFSDVLTTLLFSSLVISAIEAEILFRFIIQKNLMLGHKIVRILVAAAVYAITYIVIIFYSDMSINPDTGKIIFMNPIDLLEVIFQFGIGIILGFLYEYTNNLAVPVAFNIIYTLSNQILFKVRLSSNPHWSYYLTISLIATFAITYLCIFYFLMLKKENR